MRSDLGRTLLDTLRRSERSFVRIVHQFKAIPSTIKVILIVPRQLLLCTKSNLFAISIQHLGQLVEAHLLEAQSRLTQGLRICGRGLRIG
jgi:hypothetical protein